MHLMDEVAFITATRFTRKLGKVSKIGITSLDVKVDIYIEEMYSNKRTKAITGNFTFVALDENKKPTRVLGNL